MRRGWTLLAKPPLGALYPSSVAHDVCDVSYRKLDYWVKTGLLRPYVHAHTSRTNYLFSFRELLRIKLLQRLRDAGLSLGKIRQGLDNLPGAKQDAAPEWLVTDGQTLYERTSDPGSVRSLASKENGQLVFAAIAIGPARDGLVAQLLKGKHLPVKKRASHVYLKRVLPGDRRAAAGV